MIEEAHEIFFHVGTGKTGSTFLQSRIFPKLKGIHYIPTNRYHKIFEEISQSTSKKLLISREFDRQMEREILHFSKKHPNSHPGNAGKQRKNKPLRVPAPISKKQPQEVLRLSINLHKPLGKSMILKVWPATIQERAKRTWVPQVENHEGHSAKPLPFLRFPVGAGWPPWNTHRTLEGPPLQSYD